MEMTDYIKLYQRIRFFTLLIVGIVIIYTIFAEPSVLDNFLAFESDNMTETTFSYLLIIMIMLACSGSLRKESWSKMEIHCLSIVGIIVISLIGIMTGWAVEFIIDTYIPAVIVFLTPPSNPTTAVRSVFSGFGTLIVRCSLYVRFASVVYNG